MPTFHSSGFPPTARVCAWSGRRVVVGWGTRTMQRRCGWRPTTTTELTRTENSSSQRQLAERAFQMFICVAIVRLLEPAERVGSTGWSILTEFACFGLAGKMLLASFQSRMHSPHPSRACKSFYRERMWLHYTKVSVSSGSKRFVGSRHRQAGRLHICDELLTLLLKGGHR